MNGLDQLDKELKIYGLSFTDIEAVVFHSSMGDMDADIPRECLGVFFSQSDIYSILIKYVIQRYHHEDWNESWIGITVYTPDLIIFNYEYDSSLQLRSISRHPS